MAAEYISAGSEGERPSRRETGTHDPQARQRDTFAALIDTFRNTRRNT